MVTIFKIVIRFGQIFHHLFQVWSKELKLNSLASLVLDKFTSSNPSKLEEGVLVVCPGAVADGVSDLYEYIQCTVAGGSGSAQIACSAQVLQGL